MKELFDNGKLTEINDLQNVSYILNDDELFLSTEYKVLQAQENNGFVNCFKIKFNGKIKLLYLTTEYKSLFELLPSLVEEHFFTIIANLLRAIIEVKANGFLNCFNIDISLDKIFVDINTLEVYLVYLPIIKSSNDMDLFDHDLRDILLQAIKAKSINESSSILNLYEKLDSESTSVEELYRIICEESSGNKKSHNKDKKNKNREIQHLELHHKEVRPKEIKSKEIHTDGLKEIIHNEKLSKGLHFIKGVQPQLLITSTEDDSKIQFFIDKPEYVIGKNPNAVDGVIDFNNAISRVHCKIVYKGRKYYVVDLNSANGTFLNSKRLMENKPSIIKSGDSLKLANIEFKISF